MASGAPAPAVYETVEIEGRTGVVFQRAEGRSMLDELFSTGSDVAIFANQGADIHAQLLGCQATDLPEVKEKLARQIALADALTQSERDAATRLLLRLPDGDSVLHGDFHPGNIQLTTAGPVVIDWNDATRGSPAADIARSMWLISPTTMPPDLAGRSQLAELATRFRTVYLQRVLALMGLHESDIHAWQLPVVAARLSEGIDHEELALVEAVRQLVY